MIIMFVRHAEAKNDKITDFGKKQLQMAKKENESFEFAKIYSSPLNRCVATAKAFQEKFSVDLEVLDGLKDRELLEHRKPQNDDEEELADLMEVIYSIAKVKNINLDDVEAIRIKKKEKRGGFDKKIYLESVKKI